MKTLLGLFLALTFSAGLFAQYHSAFGGATPIVTGGFGSVVNPGGTPATFPALNRFAPGTGMGGIVLPNGSPHLVVPGSQGARGGGHFNNATPAIAYPYPVYVGSYGSGYDTPPPQPQQGNVTVVYPPQPSPVIINQYGPGSAPPAETANPVDIYPSGPPAAESETPEPTHYLIAFKDHTVYSAVAYWVQGDTLHYFTSGNVHNQVSLSLVDRDLTERLNRESGVAVDLTPLVK